MAKQFVTEECTRDRGAANGDPQISGNDDHNDDHGRDRNILDEQKNEEMMTIKIRKRTPGEIEADVERYSRIGNELAAICEGKDSEDVFYASLLFFSNNYAMNLDERRRVRMIRIVHAQLFVDANEAAQDKARQHWLECADCRPDLPCQGYFELIENITDTAGALTLRVKSDGSFEPSDQPCPNEG